jgi:fumarylacetoacetate (FAA) hydrolase family protein
MKLIKSVFLAGLFFVVLAAGAFAMYNRGAFNSLNFDTTQANQLLEKLPPQLASFLPKNNSNQESENTIETTKSISFDQKAAEEQIKILTERSEEVSTEIGKVLGDFIQVNETGENQALHEKALEHGQYVYCQQVVEQYEAQQSIDKQ